MPSKRPQTGTGFTLIEVVIVMSIIAILALMAVPSLMGKTARKQVDESMLLLKFATDAVLKNYRDGVFPADNVAAGLPPPERLNGNYVASVTVKDGAVTMTFGNKVNGKIAGKKLTSRPWYDADPKFYTSPVGVVCNTRAPPANKTVVGKNETSIDADVLPPECR
jgi:type IV pilus assembly protein PilA